MGHYAEINFIAPLNDFGDEIVAKITKTRDWDELASYYREYYFLNQFAQYPTHILNSEHINPKFDGSGWIYDPEKKVWEIAIYFKDHGEQRKLLEGLKEFLPYIILSDEIDLIYAHECGDWKKYVTKIERKELPNPDWNLW